MGEIADKSSVTSRRKLPAEAENNAMGRLKVTQNNTVRKDELEDQVSNPSECFTLVFLYFTAPAEMLINEKKGRLIPNKTLFQPFQKKKCRKHRSVACVSSGYKQTVAGFVLLSGDVLLRLSLLFVPHLLLA